MSERFGCSGVAAREARGEVLNDRDFERLVNVPGYNVPREVYDPDGNYHDKPGTLRGVPDSGCLKLKEDPDYEPGAFCGFFGERVTVIPEREWKDAYDAFKPSLRPLVHRILDQNGEGSCTANALTGSFETLANQMYGLEVTLSAISLYKRTGRSPNSGSTVSGNMREAATRGILPHKSMAGKLSEWGLNPNHVMDHVGFHRRFPQDWEQTAFHFRIVRDEMFEVRNINEFVTALLLGYPVHYGRRGHSIWGAALVYRDGRPYCCYANSWHQRWGDQGFGYDTISGLRSSINSYGAFAYRSVILPPKAIPEVPELVA